MLRKNSQKGFVTSLLAILVLAFMLSLAMSISAVILIRHGISENEVKSSQSYYAAESGIEDSLWRLKKNPQMAGSNYSINVDGFEVDVQILELVAGSRAIVSQGDFFDRIKKVRAVYGIDSEQVSFRYGVQAGDLGLTMAGNSIVYGNIFSNGEITGASNTEIYGDAISAGPNGKIKNSEVKISGEGGGSAWAVTCENSQIDRELHYTNDIGCTALNKYYHAPDDYIETESMPIGSNQITNWKNEAEAGGTITGYTLGGNEEDSLGPIKVNGNMTLSSNAVLTVNGTIWVTGTLNLNSNSVIELASDYSSFSGVIVVDGSITLSSNVTVCGSEGYMGNKQCNASIGSYLMFLSTKSSSDPNNPAILASGNTNTSVLYAANGFINLSSNAELREATGRGIYMNSNAEVTYETGLANSLFSSGPGGSWQVKNWSETE